MATFADWVNENVGSEDLRAKVTAVAVCLDDLKACSEEMLSHALNLDDWPLLARHRFLDAWRVLKAEGAVPAPAVAPSSSRRSVSVLYCSVADCVMRSSVAPEKASTKTPYLSCTKRA